MPVTEVDDSQRAVLSDIEDADSEVETLPGTDTDDENQNDIAANGTQLRRNDMRNSSGDGESSASRVAAQAAKAIEAAEGVDRVSPPSRSPELQQARPIAILAPTIEANEHTPLLDAGPAQPPPDYAAATAWRRGAHSRDANPAYRVHLQESPFILQASTNQQPLPLPHSNPTLTSEPDFDPDPESGHTKEYRKPRSVLHKVCGTIYNTLYFLLILSAHAWRLVGTGVVAFVRRCAWLSFTIVLGVFIAVLVVLILKKHNII